MRRTLIAATLVSAAFSSGCGNLRLLAPSPESLRARTAVVYVRPNPRVAELFHGIAQSYERKGEPERAAFFDAHVGIGFGSAFTVRHGGQVFAVTNRHVIDLAEESVIELGETRMPAEVVYMDPLYDLAVLVPRDGVWPRGTQGLPLSSMKPRDLDGVIATGFPALGGRPSYQSTQGSISNAAVPLGAAVFVQHSAPIDPGSSGGPLLNETGYVIGVNTGKAPGRDNVYLAVPAPAVKAALAAASERLHARESSTWMADALRGSCRALGAELGAEHPSPAIVSGVGNDLVASRGFESLNVVDHDSRTTSDDKKLLRVAFQREPVALLRLAVAVRLWNEVRDVDGGAVDCVMGDAISKDLTAHVTMRFQKRTHQSVWRFEQGQWRLASIDGLRPPPALPDAATAGKGHEGPSKSAKSKKR